MPALMRQIALVSESELIPPGDLSRVAAAIQKQATRDLSPIWEINATVDVFAQLEDVPIGYWSVIVRDDIDDPSAAGIHEDENGQPFALVMASSDINVWSITASHEALEMLVDPSGNRLVGADAKSQGRRVNYLVEVCDPSEAAEHGYSCNGIFVSDFYTPNYFDPVKAGGVRYSFTGAITEPLQVLPGGYLSWQDPESNSWWQETWFDGGAPKIVGLGPIDQRTNGNVRAVIDRATMSKTIRTLSTGRKRAIAAGFSPEQNQVATTAHARNLRARIGQIVGHTAADSPVPKRYAPAAAQPESPDVVAEDAPQLARAFDVKPPVAMATEGKFAPHAYFKRGGPPVAVAAAAREEPIPDNLKAPTPYFKRPTQTVGARVAGAPASWDIADLCKAYDWPTGLVGGGTIAIVELDGGWVESDMRDFFARNNLPYPTITDVPPSGNNPNQHQGALDDPDIEVAMDIQVAAAAYSLATGKPANIRVYWSSRDARAASPTACVEQPQTAATCARYPGGPTKRAGNCGALRTTTTCWRWRRRHKVRPRKE